MAVAIRRVFFCFRFAVCLFVCLLIRQQLNYGVPLQDGYIHLHERRWCLV